MTERDLVHAVARLSSNTFDLFAGGTRSKTVVINRRCNRR